MRIWIQSVENGVVCGSYGTYGSPKIIENSAIRQNTHEFNQSINQNEFI